MSKVFLRAKTEVTIDGQPYLIERQCADGVWALQNTSTGRAAEKTNEELLEAYVDGRLVFKPKPGRTLSSPVPRERLPQAIGSKKLSVAVKARLILVRAALGLPYTAKVLEGVINATWDKIDPRPPTKPHWTSLYRWVKTFQEGGGAGVALRDDVAAKGNRAERYPQAVIDVCEDVLDNVYFTEKRPTVQTVTDLAVAKIRRINALAPAADKLPEPSRRLMDRLIQIVPAFERRASRFGMEVARRDFRSVNKARVTDRPLQRAEIDHTRMNVMVVDDEYLLPMGRPWLTVLVDCHTRAVLGYCLSFEPPSRSTVARCLKFAFMPKPHLRDLYPALQNDWIAYGIPAEVVMDGGPEFYSEELELVCFELSIEQHFSPRKTPWFKGGVERQLGTTNREVTMTLPGKTFESILDRDDYDPKKHAVVTLTTLNELIVRFFVDLYMQKPHRALGCSPAEMWKTSIDPHDIPLLQDPLRFDAILGGRGERQLTHKGIEFDGLFYNSPDLAALRRHYADKMKVQIRFDRGNLGSIIVLHPERGTPYKVPCLRLDYAEGLTQWQHKICQRYTRRRLQSQGDVNAWKDSLLEISELIQRELNLSSRKTSVNERIARWREARRASEAAAKAPRKAALPSAAPQAAPTPQPSTRAPLPAPTPAPTVGAVPESRPQAMSATQPKQARPKGGAARRAPADPPAAPAGEAPQPFPTVFTTDGPARRYVAVLEDRPRSKDAASGVAGKQGEQP